MNTLPKIRVHEENVVIESPELKAWVGHEDVVTALNAAGAVAAREAAEAVVEVPGRGGWLKDVALFLAAPFIGLLYAVLMPFVGLGMVAWFGVRAALRSETLKFIAKAVAAPFIGLAFVLGAPFAGLATLVWMGGRRLVTTGGNR